MSWIIKKGNVILPAPVSITHNDEIIWSSDSGRSADATMLADVIAEKKNMKINWGFLTGDQMKLIKTNLCKGFYDFTFRDCGEVFTIKVYRGTLTREHLGWLDDGIEYFRSASVSVIQK